MYGKLQKMGIVLTGTFNLATPAKSGVIHAKRRKKILSTAKGFIGGRHRLYRTGQQ